MFFSHISNKYIESCKICDNVHFFISFIEIIHWNEFWLKQPWVVINLTHHQSSKRNNYAYELVLLVAFDQ